MASLMLLALWQVPFAPWQRGEWTGYGYYRPMPQAASQPALPPAMPWQRTQIIVQTPVVQPYVQPYFVPMRPYYQPPPRPFWGL